MWSQHEIPPNLMQQEGGSATPAGPVALNSNNNNNTDADELQLEEQSNSAGKTTLFLTATLVPLNNE